MSGAPESLEPGARLIIERGRTPPGARTSAEHRIRCTGSWSAERLHGVEQELGQADWPAGPLVFDLSGLTQLDTVGAWLLSGAMRRLEADGQQVRLEGASAAAGQLLQLVSDNHAEVQRAVEPPQQSLLATTGSRALAVFDETLDYLAFLGATARTTLHLLLHPRQIRAAQVVKELYAAGVSALSIVGLLSFLIGIVIAYQGGIVLKDYGANIYIADIVGLSMVRELAPLITAIIVAGRTGSSYAAQIGAMVVTDEIDALRSIGIVPVEMLVIPKLFALVIALPLLTVYSDFMGILGGLLMASTMLDLNPATYLNRLEEALTLESYLSGVGKTPVFAAIVATIGCFQGFRAFGGAVSVGRQTTMSVVQSIFLVIVVDGLFSVAFSKLGI